MLPAGYPIRKPLDHSSVTSSPRLIAGSYVLHRLLVPRHPPCALTNLTTKMLASTVQFSSYERRPTPTPAPTHPPANNQETDGSPQDGPAQPNPPPPEGKAAGPATEGTDPRPPPGAGPIPQDPTACQTPTHRTRPR